MSRTGAAFSVRFLRNGDQISIVRNIIKSNGDGAALFQVVVPNSGNVVPNWSQAANQPIIQIGARSANGYPVEITGVTWAYDGTTLTFVLNGSTWVTATNDNRFQARINGNFYELKIVNNLASTTVVSNKQITYEVAYVSNAHADTVRGSVEVLIQQAGTDSSIMQITVASPNYANGTGGVELGILDVPTTDPSYSSSHTKQEFTQTTLTAVGYYGTDPVTIGSNGWTIKWYQDGVELSGQTSATLTVTRAMVAGGSIFVAKLFKDGYAVAQDSQRINDISDEYQVAYTPTDAGSNYCAPDHNATYTLSLKKNGANYFGTVTYAWQIYNALGVAKTSGTGATVTVTPADCQCGSGDGAYYTDCDVQVTADFT